MATVSVHILTVGSDATSASGSAGTAERVAERFADAGHTVSGPVPVVPSDLPAALGSAPGADVCVVVGGVGPRGLVPGVLAPLFEHPLPGFGELLRALAFTEVGASAVCLRATAGITATGPVYALPDEAAVALLAVDKLILPDLDRWALPEVSERASTATPIPFGGASSRSVGLTTSEGPPPPGPANGEAAESDRPPPGWKSAVHALGAELTIGRAEDLPEPIEKLAPVVNVLHTAGEAGTLKLPSGRRYSVFGWPDLRRDGSKVLAVGWGDPLAEIVALHRHPRSAGTCVSGGSGMLARAEDDVEAVAKQATGRAPPDTSGTLFAMQEGAVWILRGRRVVHWDGDREKDDGNPKQVLSSLTLHWSNR